MGKKVALVEKEYVGGTCLNVGCIPAKTFLRSSKVFHECKEASRYGVRVGSVEFDMPAVVERKNRIVGTLTKGVETMLKRAGVEVIRGTARLVSRGVVQIGEQRLETGKHAAGDRFAASGAVDPGHRLRARPRFQYRLQSNGGAGIPGDRGRRLHRPGVRLFL